MKYHEKNKKYGLDPNKVLKTKDEGGNVDPKNDPRDAGFQPRKTQGNPPQSKMEPKHPAAAPKKGRIGAGDGNRTRIGSLEGYCPTFRPRPLNPLIIGKSNFRVKSA
jgi:hypothetical protein